MLKELDRNDPICQFMRGQNAPPEKGWIMIVPLDLHVDHKYVKTSRFIKEPIFLNTSSDEYKAFARFL